MTVVELSPTWALIDDGQVMLMNRKTGFVYGPDDIVLLYQTNKATSAKLAVAPGEDLRSYQR